MGFKGTESNCADFHSNYIEFIYNFILIRSSTLKMAFILGVTDKNPQKPLVRFQ